MSLIKQPWGDFFAIGGKPQEVIPLSLSLHNWGGINLAPKISDDYDPMTDTSDYLNLGYPQKFIYILVSEDRFIRARAKAFVYNWPFNYKGKSGRIPWSLSLTKAKLELSSIKQVTFLLNNYSEINLGD